ncbi:hypothetical protein MRX96_018560 [Rhipicephalus microplus]
MRRPTDRGQVPRATSVKHASVFDAKKVEAFGACQRAVKIGVCRLAPQVLQSHDLHRLARCLTLLHALADEWLSELMGFASLPRVPRPDFAV